MTKDDLRNELKKIEDERKTKRNEAFINYALANNKVEYGDVVSDGSTTIKVEKFGFYVSSSEEETEGRGLIRYLMKHRHGTPFEHNLMTFFVRAPICVWREWHRHRVGFSYNEESGRYKQLEPEFYIPSRSRPMMKVEGWKPGKPKFTPCEDDEKYRRLCTNLIDSYKAAYLAYEDNLSMGFDPGLARDCLPVGIYSSCWVTCNARSLMAFLSLRTHEPDSAYPSYP